MRQTSSICKCTIQATDNSCLMAISPSSSRTRTQGSRVQSTQLNQLSLWAETRLQWECFRLTELAVRSQGMARRMNTWGLWEHARILDIQAWTWALPNLMPCLGIWLLPRRVSGSEARQSKSSWSNKPCLSQPAIKTWEMISWNQYMNFANRMQLLSVVQLPLNLILQTEGTSKVQSPESLSKWLSEVKWCLK